MVAVFNNSVLFTDEGGIAVKITNKTGSASVKGEIAQASSTTDNAFSVSATDNLKAIGIVYEAGVADGDQCWVVVYGIAEVLLKDTTASTRGYWVKTSDTVGRADATNAAPPGGTVQALEEHAQEIGHCLESQAGGTDVLCKIIIHWN